VTEIVNYENLEISDIFIEELVSGILIIELTHMQKSNMQLE
jgi:hypothetical protein